MANNKYRVEHKEYQEDPSYVKCSALCYSKVWHTYIKEIVKQMLAGKHVLTPIGTLRIIKKKTTIHNIRIDWNRTIKEKTTVYHFNEHSGGYKILPKITRNLSIRKYSCMFAKMIDWAIAKYVKQDKNNYKKYETNKPRFTNI